MLISIWTIGKDHDKNLKNAMAVYEKRLRHFTKFEWRIIKASQKKEIHEIQKDESDTLLKMMTPTAKYILLDERGQPWNNQKWATEIARHQVSNPHDLVYIIGGAYGVDERVRQHATSVSISPLILPHQIVRLILIEQLYRSFSIMNGAAYHHI